MKPTDNRNLRSTKTISDVAALAGVSRATVSRVVNGTANVSSATRDAVMKAIEQTGFTVNPQARALALGRTNSIAVLLTEPFDELYVDPTYAAVLRGINDALSQTSMFPLLMQVHTEAEHNKALQYLKHRAVDALIHLSPYHDQGILDALYGTDLPVVMCGQLVNNPFVGRYANVYADDVAGAALAAKYAQSKGGTVFSAIMGEASNPASIDRVLGYKSVVGDGLPDSRIRYGDWGSISGGVNALDLLTQHPDTNVILCGSDRIASGVIGALHSLDRKIPEDVLVVGFDDHKIAAQTTPLLTTIAQPLRMEGETSVQLALEMLEGGKPRDVVLDMELIQRESA